MISLLWARFGPYHLARLDAMQRHSSSPVIGIEMFREDMTYKWELHGTARQDMVTVLPSEDGHSPWDQAQAIQQALDQIHPDVVGICGYSFPYALGALHWCLKNRKGAVLFSDNGRNDVPRIAWKEAIKGWVVRQFGSALVGGASHAGYLEELGMDRQAIFDGYDTVDTTHFCTPHCDTDRIRAEIGGGAPYFLTVARFQPKKNLLFLIDAYARYREITAKPWKLVILGDGPLRPEMEARIKALGLTDYVLMPGFLQYPVLPAWYQAAGAFLLPSLIEQWGLVANEALAAGLPAIVSERCGCAGEIVQEGRNGFVLPAQDLTGWAGAMQRLTEDTVCARALGKASKEIMQEWGLERFASHFLDAATVAQGRRKGLGVLPRLLLPLLMKRVSVQEHGTIGAASGG